VLAQKGYLIIRDKETTVFRKNGTEKGPEACFSKGLYFIKIRELKHGGNALTSITEKLWHGRLAHINMKALQRTVEKHAATG
jgi:hypothetical protein